MDSRLEDMEMEFKAKGGVHIGYVESILEEVEDCDILVVMAGGNELQEASFQYYTAAHDRILAAARARGIKAVVFPSIWPRSDNDYNAKARRLANYMNTRYWKHPLAVHWEWDRRQAMRNYDGVHLLKRGYAKAARYLVSLILWTKRNRLTQGRYDSAR
jgi:lysophospholipase L1-like esterase